MKRFIDIHVPVTRCNLQCHYCYVPQSNMRDAKETPMLYSPEHIGKSLSVDRLGGVCHINMCGLGETLIPNNIVEITREILKQGHYIMIVTNGTLTKRFHEFINLPVEYRKRLGFKFSFHYLELKRLGILDRFFENVQLVRENGMSFSLEMTPCDELEPYIDEIKEICYKYVGALCHLTIPRDMTKENIVLLSKHNFNTFYNIWKVFDSDMFEYKATLWGEQRSEFCYAGAWSGMLNIGNGNLRQCYGNCTRQNIMKDLSKPIEFIPMGHCCDMPHCYNSHSLLGLGCIPEIKGNYALERDRVDRRDNSHWLTKEMYDFLSNGMDSENIEYTLDEQKKVDKRNRVYQRIGKIKKTIKKWLRK